MAVSPTEISRFQELVQFVERQERAEAAASISAVEYKLKQITLAKGDPFPCTFCQSSHRISGCKLLVGTMVAESSRLYEAQIFATTTYAGSSV